MGGKYTVIVSKQAMQMLAEHVSFMANVDECAANVFKNFMLARIRDLEKMPNRNPWLEVKYLPYKKYKKYVVKKQYGIIYQVDESINKVYVEYIVDFRQNFELLFDEPIQINEVQ